MSANSGNYLFKGSSTSNTFLANDLSTGNHYKFRVIPHNDAGEGPSSGQSKLIIAAEIPDQPTNLFRKHATSEFITIGWMAPTYDGGAPVT